MNKGKIAFLSMDDLDGYISDDELAIAPLAARGWQVETLSWRQPCDWNAFALVIIRTTWDYQKYTAEFLKALAQIEASNTKLANQLALVKWNIEKTYLRELHKKGCAIVETIWQQVLAPDIRIYFDQLQTQEIIIKPLVSANADDTYRLRRDRTNAVLPELRYVFSDRPFLVQPFMHNIIREGEFSLFYFNGRYSHAILKKPQERDFRVQEEHGGRIYRIEPEEKLQVAGKKVMLNLPQRPLYARLDFVRNTQNDFEIMEVELIEPALYFRFDANAAEKFAQAVDECTDLT